MPGRPPPAPVTWQRARGGSRRRRGTGRRPQPRGHGCGAGAARRERGRRRARGCGSLSWRAGKAQPGSGERHPRPHGLGRAVTAPPGRGNPALPPHRERVLCHIRPLLRGKEKSPGPRTHPLGVVRHHPTHPILIFLSCLCLEQRKGGGDVKNTFQDIYGLLNNQCTVLLLF